MTRKLSNKEQSTVTLCNNSVKRVRIRCTPVFSSYQAVSLYFRPRRPYPLSSQRLTRLGNQLHWPFGSYRELPLPVRENSIDRFLSHIGFFLDGSISISRELHQFPQMIMTNPLFHFSLSRFDHRTFVSWRKRLSHLVHNHGSEKKKRKKKIIHRNVIEAAIATMGAYSTQRLIEVCASKNYKGLPILHSAV